MNRLLLLPAALGLLALTACQSPWGQSPGVDPPALPELREAALGRSLNFGGQVARWTAGQANVVLEPQPVAGQTRTVIGGVGVDGRLTVQTSAVPADRRPLREELLGATRPGVRCTDTLDVTPAGAAGTVLASLSLAAGGLSPATSPVEFPALRRGVQEVGRSRLTLLVYAEDDARISGTQRCQGSASGARWESATSVNLRLRAGWNAVDSVYQALPAREVSGQPVSRSQRTLEGSVGPVGEGWTYNGAPLLVAQAP